MRLKIAPSNSKFNSGHYLAQIVTINFNSIHHLHQQENNINGYCKTQ